VWREALARGASVRLRIEDHDRARCREEFVDAIRHDLRAWGFAWQGESRQGERGALYQAHFESLRGRGLLYACDCTRKEILAGKDPAACRERGLPFAGHAVRVRLPSGRDPVVRTAALDWTYPFCVVVDDFEEGIDFVVRGEDLAGQDGPQAELGALIGRGNPPLYIHHALVCGPDGKKLSKRDGAARAFLYLHEQPWQTFDWNFITRWLRE
jgi:glutamyl/glutaminyl-tRNA synthetase